MATTTSGAPAGRPSPFESTVRLVILLLIGGMAGAAAFTHVHDLTVAHGQPEWIGWANATALELMSVYVGLEIRHRKRTNAPVAFVGSVLAAAVLLSLAVQVADAERSIWGWILAALPALAFLVLVKCVLSAPAPVPSRARPRPSRSAPRRPGRHRRSGAGRPAGRLPACRDPRGPARQGPRHR